LLLVFFSSRRRHTRSKRDWSSDVCSSVLRCVWGCGFVFLKKREAMEFYQFSTPVVLLMLAVFYGGTYLMTLMIRKEEENTDAYKIGKASCRERGLLSFGTF